MKQEIENRIASYALISRLMLVEVDEAFLENIEKDQELYHLYLHWCAKEALYKICDKVDINFVTNLNIEPFKPKQNGLMSGTVNNSYMNEKFVLNYFTLKNYSIVLCYK